MRLLFSMAQPQFSDFTQKIILRFSVLTHQTMCKLNVGSFKKSSKYLVSWENMGVLSRRCRMDVVVLLTIMSFLCGKYFSMDFIITMPNKNSALEFAYTGRNYSVSNVMKGVAETGVSCPDPVKERLLDANDNWIRGVAARRELERTNPIDKEDQWNFKKGVSFYDFFYPTFDCPHTVERVGRSGDGGKWLCGIKHVAKYSAKSPCVVYSYGISYETSFEEDILKRTSCSVYMFDQTINVEKIELPRKYPGRAFIEKVGLGVDDAYDSLRSLKSQMKKGGHEFLEILKFDVEGAEFDVLNSFVKEFPSGLPFGQLACELHLWNVPYANFYQVYNDWMNNMEAMGLRAFRNELNILCLKYTSTHNPVCVEYSFINVKGTHNLLHS